MTEPKLEMLAAHLGHDVKTHKENSSHSTQELTKVSQLLLAVESGQVNNWKGKHLSEVSIADLPAIEDILCEEGNNMESDDEETTNQPEEEETTNQTDEEGDDDIIQASTLGSIHSPVDQSVQDPKDGTSKVPTDQACHSFGDVIVHAPAEGIVMTSTDRARHDSSGVMFQCPEDLTVQSPMIASRDDDIIEASTLGSIHAPVDQSVQDPKDGTCKVPTDQACHSFGDVIVHAPAEGIVKTSTDRARHDSSGVVFQCPTDLTVQSPMIASRNGRQMKKVSAFKVTSTGKSSNGAKKRPWTKEENEVLVKKFKFYFAGIKRTIHNTDMEDVQKICPSLRLRTKAQIRSKLNNIKLGKCKQ